MDIKLLLKKLSSHELTLVVCCSKKSIDFTSIVSFVCIWSKNNYKIKYIFKCSTKITHNTNKFNVLIKTTLSDFNKYSIEYKLKFIKIILIYFKYILILILIHFKLNKMY